MQWAVTRARSCPQCLVQVDANRSQSTGAAQTFVLPDVGFIVDSILRIRRLCDSLDSNMHERQPLVAPICKLNPIWQFGDCCLLMVYSHHESCHPPTHRYDFVYLQGNLEFRSFGRLEDAITVRVSPRMAIDISLDGRDVPWAEAVWL